MVGAAGACNSRPAPPYRPPSPASNPMSLLLAATRFGLATSVLVAALAVLNGVLALMASVAIWKTYLAIGVKVLLIAVVFIPIVGLIVFALWGQKKVRANQR